jgi:hypothetical protein
MGKSVDFIAANDWKGLYYYLIFPMDLFRPDTDEQQTYMQFKLDELLPVVGWLVPLLVLLTVTTTSLNFFGLVFFFAFEAALLALLTKFHLKLAWNQTTEVGLNLWASMVGMMLAYAVLAFFFGVFTNPDMDFDIDDD